MDQTTLVGNQIGDGEKLVKELVRNRFDVTAAFWAKTSEEGSWFLYIVSKAVDELGLRKAYRLLNDIVGKTPDLGLSPLNVKLIGVSNPIAKDALDAQRHLSSWSSKVLNRYSGSRLGDVYVDETYLYPPVGSP